MSQVLKWNRNKDQKTVEIDLFSVASLPEDFILQLAAQIQSERKIAEVEQGKNRLAVGGDHEDTKPKTKKTIHA